MACAVACSCSTPISCCQRLCAHPPHHPVSVRVCAWRGGARATAAVRRTQRPASPAAFWPVHTTQHPISTQAQSQRHGLSKSAPRPRVRLASRPSRRPTERLNRLVVPRQTVVRFVSGDVCVCVCMCVCTPQRLRGRAPHGARRPGAATAAACTLHVCCVSPRQRPHHGATTAGAHQPGQLALVGVALTPRDVLKSILQARQLPLVHLQPHRRMVVLARLSCHLDAGRAGSQRLRQ
jgi:hypothetical protein